MMSMVTPPVALAAYAAASIAGTGIMPSAIAAFRFALVGFTLPFMFVFRPELLLMTTGGGDPSVTSVVIAVAVAVLGIIPLAAGIAGYLWSPLSMTRRFTLLVASALLLYPGQDSVMAAMHLSLSDVAGVGLLAAMLVSEWRRTDRARRAPG
jgi:TRAP-type uncharacterized transport system fused permease subunit